MFNWISASVMPDHSVMAVLLKIRLMGSWSCLLQIEFPQLKLTTLNVNCQLERVHASILLLAKYFARNSSLLLSHLFIFCCQKLNKHFKSGGQWWKVSETADLMNISQIMIHVCCVGQTIFLKAQFCWAPLDLCNGPPEVIQNHLGFSSYFCGSKIAWRIVHCAHIIRIILKWVSNLQYVLNSVYRSFFLTNGN